MVSEGEEGTGYEDGQMLRDSDREGPGARAQGQRSARFSMRLAASVLSVLALAGPASAADIVVDTLDGGGAITADGKCSLYEAILAVTHSEQRDSCRGGDPLAADSITLAVIGILTLSDILPVITKNVDIIGPGARWLTLSGNDRFQVLHVGTKEPGGDNVAVTVKGVTIARGLAPKNGGGILNRGKLTIRDSTFVGNRAPEDGGAISNEGRGARLNIFNSTFSGNSGIEPGPEQEEGGAIVNIDGEATIVNSTFARNHAPNTGGAIHNSEATAEVTLVNCTFADNAGNAGGGAVFTERGGAITLRNTLLARSIGDNCRIGTSGRILDEHGNLDDGTSCGLTLSMRNGTAGLDPAGLQDNSGATDTVALTAASDAIDLGLPATCADPRFVNNLDQRGSQRPTDGDSDGVAACDTGAVEAIQGLRPPSPSPDPLPPPPPPPVAEVMPVVQNRIVRCNRSVCRVLIHCAVLQAPGTSCSARVDVIVRANALRSLEGALRKAPGRIRFARGFMDVPPGDTEIVTLDLTKRGRQFVRTSRKKQIKGVAEIRDTVAPAIVNATRITLKFKRR